MLITLVQPVENAISLLEARSYLRIAHDGDDVSLLLLINAAIERVEAKLCHALVSKKVRQSYSTIEIMRAAQFAKMQKTNIVLRPKLQMVSSITLVKSLQNNGEFIEANELVKLENDMFVLNNFTNGVEIEYWTGFANAGLVPNSSKLLVMEELARIIETRDNQEFKPELNAIHGARL